MSIFKNLARIVEAPVKIIDTLLVEPVADAADMVAEELGANDK